MTYVYQARRTVTARYLPSVRVEPASERDNRVTPKARDYEVDARHNRIFLYEGDFDYPADIFPERIIETKGFKDFPDIFNAAFCVFVSEIFMELIESLEPGIHRFYSEVPVFHKDGRRSIKKYFPFKQKAPLDNTIIKEQSIKCIRSDGSFRQAVADDELVLDADVVQHRHIWFSLDYYKERFVSEELFRKIREKKIVKFDFLRHGLGSRR